MKRYQTPILAVALLCLVSIGANAASLHFGQNTYGGTIGTAIPINLFFTGFQGGTVGTFDVTLTYATDQFALQSWNFGSQFGDPTTEAFTSVTPSALSGAKCSRRADFGGRSPTTEHRGWRGFTSSSR